MRGLERFLVDPAAHCALVAGVDRFYCANVDILRSRSKDGGVGLKMITVRRAA